MYFLSFFVEYGKEMKTLFNHSVKYDRMETVYFENGVKK